MSPWLLLAALAVFTAGAACDLTLGTRSRGTSFVPYAAGALGSGLVSWAGVTMALGQARVVDLGSVLGVGSTSLDLDPLAGMFLTLIGGLGVVVSACLLGWVKTSDRRLGRGTGAGYLLLLGAVVVIVIAGDAFSFLFGWETLTAAFYVLAGVRRGERQPRAAWVTLSIGKVSGAALLLGFLLLAGRAHSFAFSAWAHVPPGGLHDAAFALVVAGFAAKAGLVPFQVWLPAGYPSAPGPVRAAMAGVAVNVAFYGLWRFLGVLQSPPVWLAVAVLTLGGVTALLGIAFAAVQSSLNRVIAYSSVENAGIILVGYGVALGGAASHHRGLVAVGLVAASLQVLAHAVAKSSLFSSTAFFEEDFSTDDLEVLRGVGHRDRFGAACFAAGSLTLAGLPPTIGFVSEWFILEALLQEFRLHGLALRLGMAASGALVALTAGVAALCFVRLLGLTILGRPTRRVAEAEARDGGSAGRAGMVVMGASCLALAAAAPWVIRFITTGLSPVVASGTARGALKSPWVLQPVFQNFSILSPSWLFVVMPVAFAGVVALALGLSRGRLFRFRRVPAWRSASAGVAGPDRYSPFGYANVLRHVLGNVLGSERQRASGQASGAEGDAHAHVVVHARVTEPFEAYLYRPARAAWLALAKMATRLQSGRLDAYMAYMLAALLAVLALVAAMR